MIDSGMYKASACLQGSNLQKPTAALGLSYHCSRRILYPVNSLAYDRHGTAECQGCV